MDHRTERLPDLVRDRARQRRHRLAAPGIGGEREIPPTLEFSPLACAALVYEPADQKDWTSSTPMAPSTVPLYCCHALGVR